MSFVCCSTQSLSCCTTHLLGKQVEVASLKGNLALKGLGRGKGPAWVRHGVCVRVRVHACARVAGKQRTVNSQQ